MIITAESNSGHWYTADGQPSYTRIAKNGNVRNTTLADAKKEEYFDYLDNLRESGVTNMFGAAPYLQEAFDLTKIEAREILKEWMENYGK